jgi:hypothetical protein
VVILLNRRQPVEVHEAARGQFDPHDAFSCAAVLRRSLLPARISKNPAQVHQAAQCGLSIGAGVPGPTTRRLTEVFRQRVVA